MHSSTWSPWWFLTWERRAYAHAHRETHRNRYPHTIDGFADIVVTSASRDSCEKQAHYYTLITLRGKMFAFPKASSTSLSVVLGNRWQNKANSHKVKDLIGITAASQTIHTYIQDACSRSSPLLRVMCSYTSGGWGVGIWASQCHTWTFSPVKFLRLLRLMEAHIVLFHSTRSVVVVWLFCPFILIRSKGWKIKMKN